MSNKPLVLKELELTMGDWVKELEEARRIVKESPVIQKRMDDISKAIRRLIENDKR